MSYRAEWCLGGATDYQSMARFLPAMPANTSPPARIRLSTINRHKGDPMA